MNTVTYTPGQIAEAIEEGFERAAARAGIFTDNADFNATLTTFWAYLAAIKASTLTGAYTRDQVSDALNRATDDAAAPGCADDIDSFAVNAALTLLEAPNATFADVATECYGEDADDVAQWLRDAT